MIDYKRSEWLNVGDTISQSVKAEKWYKVTKVTIKGITAEWKNFQNDYKESIFISDADPEVWYKITNEAP